MIERTLLHDFMAAYPAQPATAFWRAIEIGALVRHGLPDGIGLDFGCGDGILTDILLRHAGPRHLIGIDIDPLEVNAARRLPFYERLHCSSDGSIPEPDGSLDFALSNSVLEHVDDLEYALGEIGRVLRRGGRFLFTVPAPAFRDLLAGSLLPGIDRETYLATLDRRIAHRNYLDAAAWTAACAAHGLHVEACETYLDGRQVRRWETSFADDRWPSLCGHGAAQSAHRYPASPWPTRSCTSPPMADANRTFSRECGCPRRRHLACACRAAGTRRCGLPPPRRDTGLTRNPALSSCEAELHHSEGPSKFRLVNAHQARPSSA